MCSGSAGGQIPRPADVFGGESTERGDPELMPGLLPERCQCLTGLVQLAQVRLQPADEGFPASLGHIGEPSSDDVWLNAVRDELGGGLNDVIRLEEFSQPQKLR